MRLERSQSLGAGLRSLRSKRAEVGCRLEKPRLGAGLRSLKAEVEGEA